MPRGSFTVGPSIRVVSDNSRWFQPMAGTHIPGVAEMAMIIKPSWICLNCSTVYSLSGYPLEVCKVCRSTIAPFIGPVYGEFLLEERELFTDSIVGGMLPALLISPRDKGTAVRINVQATRAWPAFLRGYSGGVYKGFLYIQTPRKNDYRESPNIVTPLTPLQAGFYERYSLIYSEYATKTSSYKKYSNDPLFVVPRTLSNLLELGVMKPDEEDLELFNIALTVTMRRFMSNKDQLIYDSIRPKGDQTLFKRDLEVLSGVL